MASICEVCNSDRDGCLMGGQGEAMHISAWAEGEGNDEESAAALIAAMADWASMVTALAGLLATARRGREDWAVRTGPCTRGDGVAREMATCSVVS